MIEVGSETIIHSSREALWRHLSRVADWPRWFPGLHGVDLSEPVISAGQRWRSAGQMGRMLYRSTNQIADYKLLEKIEITGDRRPWLKSVDTFISVASEGPNCRVRIAYRAEAGFGLFGRVLLTGTLRRRLKSEAASACERLKSYVEHTLPHH